MGLLQGTGNRELIIDVNDKFRKKDDGDIKNLEITPQTQLKAGLEPIHSKRSLFLGTDPVHSWRHRARWT